jgi:glutathione S-transferase
MALFCHFDWQLTGEGTMAWVLIVMALALVQFVFFGMAVGWARGRFKVQAPATTGNEVFERYHRVHMNTLEQLIVFLPALWLYAQFISPRWAAALGAVYLAGRMIYFFSYVKDPKSRSLGFALSMLPNLVLLGGLLIEGVHMAIVTA